MGIRFHKSFKINDWIKINLNKKSAGVTIGKKGLHYTLNTSGKQTASASIPGTGLSYSTSSKIGKKSNSKKTENRKWYQNPILLLAVFAVVGLLYTAYKNGTLQEFFNKNETAQTAVATETAASVTTTTAADSSTLVYVTPSGKKYHKDDCRYLDDDAKTAISLSDALKSYTACGTCKPPTQ